MAICHNRNTKKSAFHKLVCFWGSTFRKAPQWSVAVLTQHVSNGICKETRFDPVSSFLFLSCMTRRQRAACKWHFYSLDICARVIVSHFDSLVVSCSTWRHRMQCQRSCPKLSSRRVWCSVNNNIITAMNQPIIKRSRSEWISEKILYFHWSLPWHFKTATLTPPSLCIYDEEKRRRREGGGKEMNSHKI